MPANNSVEIAEEDQWRISTYRLLARLMASAPDQAVLKMLQTVAIQTTETAIGNAWCSLAQAARMIDQQQLEQEYNTLFIGFTSGEIIPYASRYLTGFLMERPLAKLRQDLHDYGIQRQQTVCEPEDHIAAIFEAMSLLIESANPQQWTFFTRYIQPWTSQLFSDLQNSNSAHFYCSVGQLGEAFVELESMLLSLEQYNHNYR